MYTFQSGKPLVRTESLVGAHVAPTTVPPMTLLRNEDSPPASNQWQIYQAGSFLDYMPIPDEFRVETETSKRKRTAGDHPLAAWQPECPTFLDEMIRLEGRRDYAEDSVCRHCQEHAPTIRCADCFLQELYCPSCTVERHRCLPLHRLQSLGLRIQLGHRIGDTCCNPHRAFNDDFIIIDSTGIHEVGLDFCACGTMQTHVKQLLCSRLFPATVTDPKTAATFGVLEQYHLLSFESKASAFEFYQALARLSNNMGMDPPKDRYPTFLRVVHEWRILKLLKRFARGHCPDGVVTTEPGQCAVLCPACPHPGKNLPENWENASLDKRWLYALFVGIDANFRLKRKLVSSDIVDPGVSKGWSYFVEEKAYKSYLEDNKDRNQERSTCASHNAVNMADTKKSRGLAATGVGTVDCARHNMKLRNAVGDLQKGEKYINMDYLFFSAMKHHDVIVLNISYDIACQWSKHLWSRMSKLPSAFHLDHDNKQVNFLIPKFHLPAHIEPCQIDFSFNFSRHVGRTDGEAPERGWANINPIASSTKEMGPGSRRDTLDDHFGDWNWKRVVQLGRLTARKLANAVEQKADHQRELLELESCLQAQDISEWRIDIEAWELDRMQPNPFKVRVAPETQAAIRLELARIEAAELESGTNVSLHAEVPPSVLISSAIDLEDQQRRLSHEIAALGAHATDHQLAKVQLHANTLRRKVDGWQEIQLLYMPFVSRLRANEDCARSSTDATPAVKAINLWLPSAVGPDTQCPTQLHRFEWMLRYAQANDALKDIRNLLRLRSHLYKFKDNNIVGQAANTRARSTINKTDVKVSMAAERYEVARAALTALAQILDEGPAWQDIFKPLNRNRDLKSLKDMWEKETEGTRHLSWIWKTPGVAEDASVGLHDALRIEWCKARARAMRWEEEVDLLKEEQRRVIAFLDWQADWWWCQRQGRDSEHLDDCLREGLKAYAERQASLRRALSAQFQALWTTPTLPAATSIDTATFTV
ncbi:uncharacterized protein F5147DRAFT_743324 [Suillus discolor]|uniref:CxC2-like cysteine cluster KDZ transposase-associated domain-containing protein n=1 Tax=Suillus discolor TaxID=1912936 RepID=A0A9P7FE31_9AGAM|nr:uncharacterized protein F5147DRAFT_743324 [Suillus discolor]KAG2115716.1 hypothetical protein F5147DRAFT_743324 [Suillus discolor]